MTTTKPLAFFDIDGTFIRSSLLIELCRNLVRHGVFPALVDRELEEPRVAWEERHRNYYPYIMAAVEVFYRYLAGCRVEHVAYVGELTAKEQHHRVYVYTRGLIERLRATHILVAISGSPEAVVLPFVKLWNFDHVYASTAEIIDGIYNGKRLVKPTEDGKQHFVAKLLEAIPHATLTGSMGVGDTESDIPFLEMVETPIAFNPNETLGIVAEERGWRIIVERKDAIWTNPHLLRER